jgi:predicted metal-dependent hydrolase
MELNDPDTLLEQGVAAFNAGEYYDAHEYWEELWSEHQLPDRVFIQGLIQLAVGYFHLTNDNLTGARSLFAKALPKLEQASSNQRNLNVDKLRTGARATIEEVESIEVCADFDWDQVPKILKAPGVGV